MDLVWHGSGSQASAFRGPVPQPVRRSRSKSYPEIFCHHLRLLLASDFRADSFPCLSSTVD